MKPMKKAPTPRDGVYELYWYFASERQRVFERRLRGEPAPWTEDAILQKYKFCNVFRAADRVSQYLIHDVCYHDEPCSDADRLFQIIAFRIFSRIETWERVKEYLGRSPTLQDLAEESFTRALEYAQEKNGLLYTHAFILCAADAYGQGKKYLNHVELFRHMFLTDALDDELLAAHSLKEVYELLHRYPLMGDFMSYQIAIDLNYSDLINFSENDFTQPGPGALRGMKKVFEDFGDYSPAEVILWMVENQKEEFARLGLAFDGLFGRPLSAIDCQGLFCETDKYCREAVPELTSARVRIKATYTAVKAPVPLFFPPKWGLMVCLSQNMMDSTPIGPLE